MLWRSTAIYNTSQKYKDLMYNETMVEITSVLVY